MSVIIADHGINEDDQKWVFILSPGFDTIDASSMPLLVVEHDCLLVLFHLLTPWSHGRPCHGPDLEHL